MFLLWAVRRGICENNRQRGYRFQFFFVIFCVKSDLRKGDIRKNGLILEVAEKPGTVRLLAEVFCYIRRTREVMDMRMTGVVIKVVKQPGTVRLLAEVFCYIRRTREGVDKRLTGVLKNPGRQEGGAGMGSESSTSGLIAGCGRMVSSAKSEGFGY